MASFARRVRELYPRTPADLEMEIARHACRKYSGRVGRSASAKMLDASAVKLAVIAHIRHTETKYDILLSKGMERHEARSQIQGKVEDVIESWSG